MIVYGICMGPSGRFASVCAPSLPSNATVITRVHQRSIFEAYNSILDEACGLAEVEAVALVHDDVSVGPGFEEDVRRALGPDIGVIGAIGSLRPRTIAWWTGEKRGYARELDTTYDFGGGTHDVDALDGMALIVSIDCARQVRFDTKRFRGFHGYDVDYCRAAKQAGFRVIVAPLDCVHHAIKDWSTPTWQLAWRRADLAWRRKWKTCSRRYLAALWGRYMLRRVFYFVRRG